MDYQKLIMKLNETSRRVKQLEVLANSIQEQVEDGNMDIIVLNIVDETINKINSLYDMDTMRGDIDDPYFQFRDKNLIPEPNGTPKEEL